MTKPQKEKKEVFVNLKSDFGFKRIFGERQNKPLLISFLNALFQGDLVVDDVEYDNVERVPTVKDDRGIRYDIYCHRPSKDTAGEATHHFIIEMQHQSQAHFDERALYYVASSLVWQAKRGDDFEFEFVPVIGIFLMDFDRGDPESNARMVERKWMTDMDTNEPFHDLLRLYFVKLPLMQKSAEECHTERDMWIYCIKNLEHMNSVPFVEAYPVFGQLAQQASVANLSREEFVEYERSLKAYRDQRNIARHQYALGEESGLKKGKMEIARNMMREGMSLEDITRFTGLSEEELMLL